MKQIAKFIVVALANTTIASNLSYPIVGTGITEYWNSTTTIPEPQQGEPYYGQEPQFNLKNSSYTDNGDGTISDNITGLMWTKSPDINGDNVIDYSDKISFSTAPVVAETLSIGEYDDWRVPSIKEIYSLMDFTGKDPSGWSGSDVSQLTPFIDDNYFDVGFGDESAGERVIDGQYVTTSKYVSTTMNGSETMFGLNLVDGRIKGYPTKESKRYFAYFVRGNSEYGTNKFSDNGDGTITDSATGLMWSQDDSDTALNWEESFDWVTQKNSETHLGQSDWRLATIKELQSILDYSRAPKTDGTAAINPLFSCSEITVEDGVTKDFPFYWSSTTHENMNSGSNAAYMCFGTAYGWFAGPTGTNTPTFLDVHGAGAQRSDPKNGDPADFPTGHGPQGDVVRVYNYVRLVRTITENVAITPVREISSVVSVSTSNGISITLPKNELTNISLFTVNGREIFSDEVVSDVFTIPNSDAFSKNIYILKIINPSVNVSQKIFVQ